jgi:hypothetical protein
MFIRGWNVCLHLYLHVCLGLHRRNQCEETSRALPTSSATAGDPVFRQSRSRRSCNPYTNRHSYVFFKFWHFQLSCLSTDLVQQGTSEKVALVVNFLSAFATGFILAYARCWRLALALSSILPCVGVTGGVMNKFISRYMQYVMIFIIHFVNECLTSISGLLWSVLLRAAIWLKK